MDRLTILQPAVFDAKRFPLGALEAFVLSQVDGHLTLAEIAEIAGLELAQAERLARHLRDLGAVAVLDRRRSAPPRTSKAAPRAGRPDPRAEKASLRPEPQRPDKRSLRPGARPDPRAEEASFPPEPQRPERRSLRPGARPDLRAERASLRPEPQRPERRSLRPGPTPNGRPDLRAEKPSLQPAPERPERRSSRPGAEPRSVRPDPRTEPRRSTRESRCPNASVTARNGDVCELDGAVVGTILALDAKLGSLDHYALLEIERGAEKKAMKRAYFALAARFHPDRFFGKKLGLARAPLDRVFHRLTEAHDTLANPTRRAAYDATLPKAPPLARSGGAAPRKKTTKALRAVSSPTATGPGKTITPPPARAKTVRPAPIAPPPERAKTVRPAPIAPASPAPAEMPPEGRAAPSSGVTTSPTADGERQRRLNDAARELGVQARVELFLLGAEEALKVDDAIGAANNYRLALQLREDPYVRAKLDGVDEVARKRRFERSITRARAAERDERWADAAENLARAHEARPDASLADRAAHALRVGRGDLVRAAALAEQAVSLDPSNGAYQSTLGEIYLEANLLARAEAAAGAALELAPGDARAKQLAALIAKRKKKKDP
jgi:tetratricopeptide (TPR) repeat protein